MLNLEDATAKAVDYMKQIFPEAKNMLVEEVEMDDSKSFWYITPSFPLDDSEVNPYADANWFNSRRFKSLKIDAQSGEVLSMKIREFQQ